MSDSKLSRLSFLKKALHYKLASQYLLMDDFSYKYNQIECIYFFTRSLCYIQKIDIQIFFKLLDEFIKKVSNNKKINEKEIKDKIYDLEINNFINNNELDKIVEFIFSN